jgi:predicted PurR-regulated permease PerM
MASFTENETDDSHDLATRDRLLLFVLLLATVVAAYLVYLLLRPFLPALAWALALSIIAYPVHRWVGQRIRYPSAAAGVTTGLVGVAVIGPALFVMQQVTAQAIRALQWIQDEQRFADWEAIVSENPYLSPIVSWVQENVDLAGEAQQFLSTFTQSMTRWLTGTVWLVIQLLIMLLSLFFFLRDNRQAIGAVRGVVPLSNREANKVFRSVSDTIYATVFGTVAVAMIQGFMGSVIFFLMGIPGALLWGVVMGLLAIIPYLGAFVIWGPVAAFLALQGEWLKAIVLTVYGMTAIGLIDNLLYPYLVGRRMRLHTLVAFFAILGGVSAFGMSGIVLGPVVVAISLALVDIWRQRTAAGQGAENPT